MLVMYRVAFLTNGWCGNPTSTMLNYFSRKYSFVVYSLFSLLDYRLSKYLISTLYEHKTFLFFWFSSYYHSENIFVLAHVLCPMIGGKALTGDAGEVSLTCSYLCVRIGCCRVSKQILVFISLMLFLVALSSSEVARVFSFGGFLHSCKFMYRDSQTMVNNYTFK